MPHRPNRADPQTAQKTPAPRRMRRYVLPLLFVSGIYLGLCAGIAWDTVRPKPHKMHTTPARDGMRFEDVAFQSADGTRLSGWFIPAKRPRGVIVLCHGVDANRIAMLWKARILHDHGFSTLLFDFRGRGESGPSLCTIGYREVDDALAAICAVERRRDCRNLPIGVEGESEGGSVALMAAARCRQVRAVVAESPFAQLDHAVDNHFRSLLGWRAPVVAYPVRWIGELMIRCRCCHVSPLREVSKIAPRPLLLIQDADDVLCPPAETRQLMAQSGRHARIWTVPEAGHVMAQDVAPEEFERRVTGFFDGAL